MVNNCYAVINNLNININVNLNIQRQIRVKSNLFYSINDIYNILRNLPNFDINRINTIYDILDYDDYSTVNIMMIPLIHDQENLGYKRAHFMIQQLPNDINTNYIFVSDVNYHIDDDFHNTLEYYFFNPEMYYSIEELFFMIENNGIREFCIFFEEPQNLQNEEPIRLYDLVIGNPPYQNIQNEESEYQYDLVIAYPPYQNIQG